MGSRVNTMVFPFKGSDDELKNLVTSFINDENPLGYEIVIFRKKDYVIVNGIDLLWKILPEPHILEEFFEKNNFKPTYTWLFLQYDFSDSFGYAIFENGKNIRSVFRDGEEDLEPIFIGKPLDFEGKYLNATYHYIDMNSDDEPIYSELPTETNNPDPDYEPYYMKIYSVENEEIRGDLLVCCMMHELSEKLLGFNIALDNINEDKRIVIQSAKKLEYLEQQLKQSQGNKLLSWIRSIFKGK
ncbi:hypothetical protein [Phocoenobacter skyensis]|uniref:Uncharacterized protein n=1 Tax=Phocoenobacter skyensis TaxID=97481 RepID=A0A1H7U2G5_9PAST|nr:hypothetical protein [Pasteurella skyensis]MDP8078717.1 hypothetical protein [Pasteurella skyensis]MDP8084711.1 hypothetical protein [Pasteurella skyensis]MDP8184143.1 hypothetical protein [Pasteurella skyensis]QLB22802.1 hypothetical protein A6B44_06095 [Pasteurella skyensis]SEL91004.1 hypothetical protein SAMN05444853_101126 [Pasteurella skyensis]